MDYEDYEHQLDACWESIGVSSFRPLLRVGVPILTLTYLFYDAVETLVMV